MSSTNPWQICLSCLDGLRWIILPFGHFFFAVVEAVLLDACEFSRVLLAWLPIISALSGLIGIVVVIVVPAGPALLVLTALALPMSTTVLPGPIIFELAPTFVVPMLAVAATALVVASWVALALWAALCS